MKPIDCREARQTLAVRDDAPSAELTAHLEACAGCRAEAAALDRILAALAEEAELEPSAAVERAVRSMLRAPASFARPFLRSGMALGLAAAALLALLTGLGTGLAEAGAAEHGPLVAVWLVVAYFVFGSAASLPVLLYHRGRHPRGLGGASR